MRPFRGGATRHILRVRRKMTKARLFDSTLASMDGSILGLYSQNHERHTVRSGWNMETDPEQLDSRVAQKRTLEQIVAIPATLYFPTSIVAELNEICKSLRYTPEQLIIEALKGQIDYWKEFYEHVMTLPVKPEDFVWRGACSSCLIVFLGPNNEHLPVVGQRGVVGLHAIFCAIYPIRVISLILGGIGPDRIRRVSA